MIKYNQEARTFHLYSEHFSYLFSVSRENILLHHHYGKRLEEPFNKKDFIEKLPIELGSSTTLSNEETPLNLNHITTEFATYGKGDYREPTIHVETNEGYRSLDFRYETYEIIKNLHFENKPQAKKEETLKIVLKEKNHDITVFLYYTVIEHVLIRNLELINGMHEDITLDRLHSATFDFTDADFTLVSLDGAWIRERHRHDSPLHYGIVKLDSKKGVSSSDHNPFFALKRKESSHAYGETYGFNLIYSGNFEALIEVNPHRLTRVNYGINSFDFRFKLSPNERFWTPEVVSTYSASGIEGMMQSMHHFIKNALSTDKSARPIMFNNWEATYFDFKEKTLLTLAKKAKRLGIEGLCVDDGWFGNRNDDRSSLGDWYPNKRKLPNGVKGLSKKIKKQGLKFGIWVEPEMVNEVSELYKTHPEWVMRHPHITPALGRHQMVLDLSQPAVLDHLFLTLSTVFKEGAVDYVKWDMNRNFSDIYSQNLPASEQGKLAHLYVLGLYELLERLKKAFPHILFESCASGGNRFDLGMHYYMPQGWLSDNTDGYERMHIQKGSLLAYPLSTLSNHVNDDIAHQTLRHIPLETRFAVALFGVLGYELDIRKLNRFAKKTIQEQIAFYKHHRMLCQYGDFYDLSYDRFDTRFFIVDKEKDTAILGLLSGLTTPNPPYQPIKIKGLDEKKTYKITARVQYENLRRFGALIAHALPIKLRADGTLFTMLANRYRMKSEPFETTISGKNLMAHGLKLPYRFTGSGYHPKMRILPDFASRLYVFEAVQEGSSEQ